MDIFNGGTDIEHWHRANWTKLVAFPPVSTATTAAAPAVHWASAPAPVVISPSSSVIIASPVTPVVSVPPLRGPTPFVATLPSWPAHVHTRGWRVGSLGDAEVHADLPPVQLYPIQCLPSLRGVVDCLKVDECKASAAATVSIQHNLALLQGAKLAKLLLQLTLSGVQAEAKHSNTLRLVRVFPVAIVAPPVGHW